MCSVQYVVCIALPSLPLPACTVTSSAVRARLSSCALHQAVHCALSCGYWYVHSEVQCPVCTLMSLLKCAQWSTVTSGSTELCYIVTVQCTVCTVYKGCKVKTISADSHPFSYNHVNSERTVKSLYHRKYPAASTQWLSVTNCNLSSDLSSDIKWHKW